MRRNLWMTALIFFLLAFAARAEGDSALLDGNTWVKMSSEKKVGYLLGYWDGLIAGIGQGVRFAMNTRTPDEKTFKAAYDLWSGVGINTILPMLDSYYSKVPNKEMKVMHAIVQILVDMQLRKMQQAK